MNAVCAKCKKRVRLKGFSRCASCRQSERLYWRKVRKGRRREGRCPECGDRPAAGRKYCRAHLAYHAEAARAYRKQLRRAKK